MLNVYVSFGCDCASALRSLPWLDPSVCLQRALTDCFMTAFFSCNNKGTGLFSTYMCKQAFKRSRAPADLSLSRCTRLGPSPRITSVCDYWKGQEQTTPDVDNFPSVINHINPSPRQVELLLSRASLQPLPAQPDETGRDFM